METTLIKIIGTTGILKFTDIGILPMFLLAALIAVSRIRNPQPANLKPLPKYELVSGVQGLQSYSALPPEPLALYFDSFLSFTLRPNQSVNSSVMVRSFLKQDGQISRWPVIFDFTRAGTFALQGPVRELLGDAHPGACELIFIIGHAIPEKNYDQLLSDLAREPAKPWQILSKQVILIDGPQLTAPSLK